MEKAKIEKDATTMWGDVYEIAAKIRAGEMEWDELEKMDFQRLKWNGRLHTRNPPNLKAGGKLYRTVAGDTPCLRRRLVVSRTNTPCRLISNYLVSEIPCRTVRFR